MDLISLKYFYEVSKDLHITNAAKRLYISQQRLSGHIQRLEATYGVKLIERDPKPHLTAAAEFGMIQKTAVGKRVWAWRG